MNMAWVGSGSNPCPQGSLHLPLVIGLSPCLRGIVAVEFDATQFPDKITED